MEQDKFEMFTDEGNLAVMLIVWESVRTEADWTTTLKRLHQLSENPHFEEATDSAVVQAAWGVWAEGRQLAHDREGAVQLTAKGMSNF
tara:strand:- start:53 stop:316 length:264 start_codon:yes stop_codon:yes gene_type:complete